MSGASDEGWKRARRARRPGDGSGGGRGARVVGAAALASALSCASQQAADTQAPAIAAVTAIEGVHVHTGTCDAPGPEGEGFVFAREPFSVTVQVRAAEPATSRVLRLATGVDSRGVRDRIVTFDGSEVGVFGACIDGLDLDWPMLAQLRVELFEASRWQQTFESEFAVVPRDHVDTIAYPRHAHPTRRYGVPVRRGEFVRVEASLYMANGTAEPITLDGVVTGMVHDGQRAQSWAIRLDRPIEVGPYAISEVHDFHLSYPLTAGLGQRLYNDRLSMLVSAIRGSTPSPGTETRSIDWALLPGVAVDVVFVGDFVPEKRQRAASAVIDGAGGYLEAAGITLNRALSRAYVAAELGMTPVAIDALKRVDDEQEMVLLAAYQPSKSIERITVFIVEGLWLHRGAAGKYRGGYEYSTDPKTPFRSPVLAMPHDLGNGGFHTGYQAFAQLAAQQIAAAIGGLTEVDWTTCNDINPFLPENAFNLMSSSSGSYSWMLSPCQRAQLSSQPALYVY